MRTSKVIWCFHPFGWSIYLLNNYSFSLLPRITFFRFAGLTKLGIAWMGYLLEVQKDRKQTVKFDK